MKKVYIKTYGCSFNQSDSEQMAGILKTNNYRLVDNEDEADVIIVNSCTVKNKAENKFWRDIKDIEKIGKPVIMAGCVPQAEQNKNKFKGFSVIGTNQLNHVVEVVEETLNGNTVQLLKKESNERLNVPKVRKNSIVEIVPINEGCLGSCNFCKTKFARGHLKSYEPDAIVKHIRNALNDGAKEIWLTSQDTFCYGYDIDTNIVELLEKILSLKRDFKIRLGMGNPDYLPDYLDKLIPLFQDKRLFRFIHIPVQAGSDKVLREMKREYTVDGFKKIISAFKKRYSDMTLATDIIVGYPTETDEDFKKTLELVKEIRFDVINMARYWRRPGTVAAKLHPLPTKLVKERSLQLSDLFYSTAREKNKGWLGWEGKVIIDEFGKNGSLVGRNYAYKPVILNGNYKLGQEIDVKVKRTTTHDLRVEEIK